MLSIGCLSIIDKNIVITAKIEVERNIIIYDSVDGKCGVKPLVVLTIVWFACISIPARTGPREDPTNLKRVLMPKDIPIYLLGVAVVFILIWPTFSKDNPVPIIARFIDTCNALK